MVTPEEIFIGEVNITKEEKYGQDNFYFSEPVGKLVWLRSNAIDMQIVLRLEVERIGNDIKVLESLIEKGIKKEEI